jgi:CBS domain-containing protein
MQRATTEQTAVPVREIMTGDVETTTPETTIAELARQLLDGGYSGMPVVDADGLLVGMVSEYDVISKRGTTVAEIMSRGVISVAEDAGTDHVAGIMGLHGIRRVPIVRDGRLIGIVSRTDLLRLFVREQGTGNGEQE